MSRRYGNAMPRPFHQAAVGEVKSTMIKKGKAIILPRIKPFVLKFGVGIQGIITGKSISPATMIASAAKAGTGPLRKYSSAMMINVGNIICVISKGTNISRSRRSKRTRRI